MAKPILISVVLSLLTASTSALGLTIKTQPMALAGSQQTEFLNWAELKENQIRNRPPATDDETKYNEPVYLPLPDQDIVPADFTQTRRMQRTADLYYRSFGRDTVESFLWSGIESGNPRTRYDDERWDSLREEGLYSSSTLPEDVARVHNNRLKVIASLHKAGIRNIRLGMSNHDIEIDNPASWRATEAMVDDFYRGGINISLDLHHFGIEDRFRVVGPDGKTIGEKSYYLNPAWPQYFGRFVRKAIEKFHAKIKAVTIMNEPETVAGFNGEMWHGGFPGWSNNQSNKYYLQRSIQVGMASVLARTQIESYLLTLPPSQRPNFVYVHTEASVHKTYWNDFNLYRRFIISDMILGGDWLLNADLDGLAKMPMDQIVGRWGRLNDQTRTILDWVIENYIVYSQRPEDRENLRTELVAKLRSLQSLHKKLEAKFHKTMKTDTILAVDYYSHNEDHDDQNVRLNPEPQYYVEQIQAGRRVGLYRVLIEYYNHFQLPLMIGESGTPYYYYGSRWTQQVLLECAKAARQGIPFLGYTLYPAVDTWGWESALSAPRKQALHNPSGVVDLDYNVRPFLTPLVNSLRMTMGAGATAKQGSRRATGF